MTKHNVITWMAAACIAFAAHAQRPLRWIADATQTSPVTFDCSRGETLTFAPVIKAYGTTLTNYTASFQWQTNGMGGLFWSTNALVFAPSMDVGASRYRFWIRAETTNGVMYSAQGTINMLHAPGATVNALPMPVHRLDFASVQYLNAPWLLAELDPGVPVHESDPTAHSQVLSGKVSATDSTYTITVSRASSAYGWGPHASAGYLHQGESLFILEPGGGVLFPSESDAFALWLSYSGFRDSNDFFIDLPPFSNMSQTLATREWTRDYMSTGAPPAGLSGQQVTNIVETAREFHVDSYTNVIWRSVYSNGWTWLVAYTNYPTN